MKKIFVFALMAMVGLTADAQNIQLHYDFGRNIYSGEEAGRSKVTLTFEQFKADKWGVPTLRSPVSLTLASSRPLLLTSSTTEA